VAKESKKKTICVEMVLTRMKKKMRKRKNLLKLGKTGKHREEPAEAKKERPRSGCTPERLKGTRVKELGLTFSLQRPPQ